MQAVGLSQMGDPKKGPESRKRPGQVEGILSHAGAIGKRIRRLFSRVDLFR